MNLRTHSSRCRLLLLTLLFVNGLFLITLVNPASRAHTELNVAAKLRETVRAGLDEKKIAVTGDIAVVLLETEVF